jgi:non-specific serine/threonine protein kinase
MSYDAAVEYALTCETTPHGHERSGSDAPLSRREKEVAVMLGRGLTNREIARELVISKQTVDRHVSNILSKLGFQRRSQIAAWVAAQRTVSRTTA